MTSMSITVNGNVATDPQHVVGSSGKPRTTFRLASTERKRQPDGSYADGATSFVNVTCFDTLAINAAACVVKGQPVVITGALTMREWEANGRKGNEADLVVRTLGHDLRWGRAVFTRPPRGWAQPAPAVASPGAAHEPDAQRPDVAHSPDAAHEPDDTGTGQVPATVVGQVGATVG